MAVAAFTNHAFLDGVFDPADEWTLAFGFLAFAGPGPAGGDRDGVAVLGTGLIRERIISRALVFMFRLPRADDGGPATLSLGPPIGPWHSYAPGPGAYEWCRVRGL